MISGAEVLELLPALADRAPTGGYLFYDCQTDDARLVLTVLAEAERFGAVAANRLEVTGLLEEGGRARGRVVRDAETGETFPIRAAAVVNATGVWADRLRPAELHDEAEVPVIRPSRGTHVIVQRERLPMSAGAIVPAAGGRTIFVLPWLGQTLIGTTDTDYDGDIDHVRPADEDVAYLLDAVNAFFATDIVAEDIAGAYAGVRPLISTGDPRKSVDISRKAELYETSSGMVTITGGKLTTWRRMAKQTVDRIVERDGRDAPCRTHEIPLGMPVDADELTRVEGVGEEAYEQLAGRYGHTAHDVLATAAERGELAQPIVPGRPDLLAEAAYAARREQARTVGDVLLRRTRLGLTAARRLCAPGEQAPERVARRARGRAGLGRGALRARGRALPRGGRAEGILVGSGDCRRARAVTFGSSAGWTDRSPPTLEPAASATPSHPVRPARPAGPRAIPAAPRRPAGSPPQPVDGPNADIESVGNVDLARDGTRRARLPQARRRRPARVPRRASTAAVPRARARRLGARAARPRWRSRPATATGSRSPGSRTARVYATRRAPAARRARAAARPDRLSAAPARRSDLDIDLGVNGAAYALWQAGRRRRTSAPRACRTRTWTRVAPPLDIDPAREAGGRAPLRPRVAVSAEGYAVATWGEPRRRPSRASGRAASPA